jgi:hypothetical protein
MSSLRSGDIVEVRRREEILQTLDERGRLDALPFMPEMLEYCGRRFRVWRVAHKTCDTVYFSGGRRLQSTVHLEGLRCDGSRHGGCQAACLLFWKEQWLKKIGSDGRSQQSNGVSHGDRGGNGCTVEALDVAACEKTGGAEGDVRYTCQATELLNATKPLQWWEPTQYVRDVTSGNYSLAHATRTLALAGLRMIMRSRFVRGYRVLRALHNRLATLTGGRQITDVVGPIPKNSPTPASDLKLRAGDWVRIRQREEIIRTLNVVGRNAGLTFDPEMVPYCGGTFRVRAVVEKIIEESSGRMIYMKNPCIMLDNVVCNSEYIRGRLMCPRAVFPYWRPVWLEKTAPSNSEPQS